MPFSNHIYSNIRHWIFHNSSSDIYWDGEGYLTVMHEVKLVLYTYEIVTETTVLWDVTWYSVVLTYLTICCYILEDGSLRHGHFAAQWNTGCSNRLWITILMNWVECKKQTKKCNKLLFSICLLLFKNYLSLNWSPWDGIHLCNHDLKLTNCTKAHNLPPSIVVC